MTITFAKYAANQGLDLDSPFADLIDAASDHYELSHPIKEHDADYMSNWFENAADYALKTVDDWFASKAVCQ